MSGVTFLGLAILHLAAADLAGPTVPAATAGLQGRWVVVAEDRGQDRGGRGRVEVTVAGDRLTVRHGDDVLTAAYEVRSTRRGAELAVRFLDQEDPLALEEMTGVFLLEGDRLRFCLGPPHRPPERLDSRGHPMHWLVTLRRVGP